MSSKGSAAFEVAALATLSSSCPSAWKLGLLWGWSLFGRISKVSALIIELSDDPVAGLLVLVSVMCIVHSTKINYDGSNIPKHGKIIEANYTPRGEEYQIGNLTIYENPNGSGKRVLIHIYDILGMSTNIRQVEEYWNSENFPIADQEEVDAWVEQYASWNGVAKPDVQNIINHFRTTENITEFGIFGMCYGGLMSTIAAQEIPEVKAAGWVHPTYITTEMANDVKFQCVFATSNDPDYIPFYEILKSKFGTLFITDAFLI
ncbi:Carboxymethylenebutenolidase [Orchesella cincta]|uniref:Carboxymethylenebutenolidase n=1 Tax=Orchesella cincta TaxID=48709 RepID=A0A1D2M0X8_ORCCI|nr:Carboxymethylenebutenolidase [Orchesella cincta]